MREAIALSIRTLTLSCLLLLPLVAPTLAASSETPASAYESLLLARGVAPEDLDDVVVERRTLVDGAWTTETITLADLPAMPKAVPPGAPDVVVGQLPLHFMLQFSCAGYGAQPLPGGLTAIDGAWDLGAHGVLPVVAGAVALDASEPTALLTGTVHEDNSATAAGSLAVSETRLQLFGVCLLLVGTMSGTGAFAFDVASPV